MSLKRSARYLKNLARSARRRGCEALGIPWYTPRPSLNELDAKLSKYLNYRGGFFVEAGANDGYKQSNTYYLEHGLRWRGVLVEAIPDLYEKCRQRRPRARVFNCALVASDYPGDQVLMHYADLMSVTDGALGDRQADHLEQGIRLQRLDGTYPVRVRARTLESVLDEVKPRRIDFLSLDVEGYELDVLRGLNLARYRPRYILVEAWAYDDIDALLAQHYVQVEQLTYHDYLYRKTGSDSGV